MSWQSIGNDNDDDESTTIKPHLDPQAVIALASSIPNCSHVSPPNNKITTTRNNNINPIESGISESSSYFSQFSRHLQHTFSNESSVVAENRNNSNTGNNNNKRGGLKNNQHDKILSFLVSDALSIERLAAEAEGKHGSTSELEGAGIARIDVYCNSGTVCTCRVIQTTDNATELLEGGGIDGRTSTTQQKGKHDSIIQDGTQVRRIIRRKCTLEALRKILEEPPKLPEINTSMTTSNVDNNDNDDDDDDDDSQASTVSKKLRRRQLKRHMKKQSNKFTNLSKAQQKFLSAQQKKYEKRIRHDEKVRRHVGNAILAGGLDGVSSMISTDEPTMGGGSGLDIMYSKMTLSESQSAEGGGSSSMMAVTNESEEQEGISYVGNDAYNAQLVVQEKIELADMGLAILMGEAQRLERIMSAMEGDGEDTKKKKKTKNGDESSCNRSTSTFQSTDGDYDSEAGSSSDDGDDESDDDEHKLARIMQGCEVEYSFPSEHHEELESALLGDDISSSSSENENDDSDESSILKVARNRRRGRSPPRDGLRNKKNASTSIRHDDYDTISPIVAIPTNGEGCVVLRENGAFDVIGTIPDVLHKKLFRRKGPLPDHISLGTLGRYYVHFEDGSFFFYGPPSLSKILIKGNKKQQRRGKDRNRGKRDDISVTSVAFGKNLDDFFVCRSDGSWEAHGSLPNGLEGLMTDRKDRADLRWVALGANGEWCVKSKSGRVWWEGVSDEADEALAEVLAEDGENELRFVDFGTEGTYFLLHK